MWRTFGIACCAKIEIIKFGEKCMNEREMMKLAESMEEFSISDFTLEDLERLSGNKENFKEKYFEYYDDVKDRTRKKQDW